MQALTNHLPPCLISSEERGSLHGSYCLELVWILEPDSWHVHTWYLLFGEKERLLGTLDAKTEICSLGQSSQCI